MDKEKRARYGVIAGLLVLAAVWMFYASGTRADEGKFPASEFIASSQWLLEHAKDPTVLVVDVRDKKDKDMVFIDNAISLPWKLFRYNDGARGIAEAFVGYSRAQEILGSHGVSRSDSIVLYDSVKEDGGATASYVFWVLDLLGHKKIKILDRGIDGWIAAGGATTSSPRVLQSILYQAHPGQIKLRPWKNGDFIAMRLGDPHYQLLDVRSREEYLGQKPNVGLDGNILNMGHIPTAYNVDYRLNWSSPEEKAIRSYTELLSIYKGIDPEKAVIVYCHSGRRSSFSYFILRAMGFTDLILYELSWNEWGNKEYFYPAETKENTIKSDRLPIVGGLEGSRPRATQSQKTAESGKLEPMKGGYISCGG